MYLNIFTDGGARGNPGPAGIGAVIYKTENQDFSDNKVNQITRIHEISEHIGEATNNVAEYTAVVETIN